MKTKVSELEWEKYPDGKIQNGDVNRYQMRDLLNTTGCGFCLAKWTQVTIHLGVGLTHSCHHVRAHKIPLDELKENPGALHNTKEKKQRRKEMLLSGTDKSKRPVECDFCWRIEDNTGELSDRVYKSLDNFSVHDHDDIKLMTGDENFYPRYVEISFNNTCNQKCAYCGPTFSSKWMEEIKKYGPYIFTDKSDLRLIEDTQISEKDENPYIDAFWEWFPEAVEHMVVFRITGGEPLLSNHTSKVLDYLIENPKPNLEFAINTNANPPEKVWKNFTDKVNAIVKNNCVKKFTLFASAESCGKQTEYTRYGMNWNQFKSNIEYFLKNTRGTGLFFMSAFNILSLSTFKEFLQYILELKNTYNKDIGIDISYVRNPNFLDCNISSLALVEKYLSPAVDFMYENSYGFKTSESAKLKRILVDTINEIKGDREYAMKNRSSFYEFVNEYDIRRNTNFLEYFPEMTDFYNLCKFENDRFKDFKTKEYNATT